MLLSRICISRQGLEAVIGVCASSICLAEVGTRGLTVKSWLQLANALELHIEDILPRDKE